ncbi:MAG: hypothetical protein JST90_17975 [Bacteroidetes bacterium]|nr:hypothetical protein [Bacteroidota bacterium]
MLKANFKISETGGTGVVQLQALLNSTIGWANVGSPITLANGQKTVDDNTDIEIDTTAFDAGMTYQFRLTDVAGTPVSNTVLYQVPYTQGGNNGQTVRFVLLKMNIDFLHATDDNWTVTFEFDQGSLASYPATTLSQYQAAIYIYQAGVHTRIMDDEQDHVTRDSSYTTTIGGYGAGVYYLTCTYGTADGRHASIAQLVKVDDAGNILMVESAGGHTLNYANSTDISVDARCYLDGTPCAVNWFMATSDNIVTGVGNGQTLTSAIPADNKFLYYEPVIDATLTTDFDGKFTSYMQVGPALP